MSYSDREKTVSIILGKYFEQSTKLSRYSAKIIANAKKRNIDYK